MPLARMARFAGHWGGGGGGTASRPPKSHPCWMAWRRNRHSQNKTHSLTPSEQGPLAPPPFSHCTATFTSPT